MTDIEIHIFRDQGGARDSDSHFINRNNVIQIGIRCLDCPHRNHVAGLPATGNRLVCTCNRGPPGLHNCGYTRWIAMSHLPQRQNYGCLSWLVRPGLDS